MNKTAIAILISASCFLGYAARDVADTPPAQAEPQPVAVAKPEKVENSTFDSEESVVWVKEADAKASGKPVLYFVTYSKGCAPCVKIKSAMETPAGVEALSHFSCVKIDLTEQRKHSPNSQEWKQYNSWLHHYGVSLAPSLLLVRQDGGRFLITPQQLSGGLPALLQLLRLGEDFAAGKELPSTSTNDPKEDPAKTSIAYPPKPTLAPASHDTAAPFPTKGRSSGKQERSCVTCQVARGKCFRSAPGIIGQWTFRPGRGGRR